MIINDETARFIRQHRRDDVRTLALKGSKDKAVDMPFALDQIQGWQTARQKLPTWAAAEGIIYPPHLNMEQCSSEETARYKHECIARFCEPDKATLIDLTGGFGADFSLMSRGFHHAVYVERNASLVEVAQHNFEVLGLHNVEVVNGDGVAYLHQLTAKMKSGETVATHGKTVIYLDPHGATVMARRCFA